MKNRLTHNLGLKILALVFSMGLWFVVNNITDPTIRKPFTNIPVEIINEEKITNEGKVYEVLEDTDTVNVWVTGKQSIMNYITKDDIKAVADLSELTFMNTVSIKLSSAKYNSELEFTSSADNLKLSIEDMKRVQMIINTSTSGEPAAEYVVGTVTPSQNVVRLSGPESLINQIDHVEAVANIAGYSTDINSSVELKLCDAEGNEIKSNSIKANITTIDVAVTILGTKEIPVNFIVQGEPAAGYVVSDEMITVPETVTVAGKKSALESITELNVADSALEVDDLKENMTTIINIRKYLPSGIQFADSTFNGNVSVTVGIEPIVTQEFEIPVENFAVGNVPEEYNAYIKEFENEDIQSYKVSLSGIEKDIKKVDAKDIIGVVDMKIFAEKHGITEWTAGSYVSEITFNLPENIMVEEPYSLTVILENINEETTQE